jgi:hypothetical protein
MPDRLAEIRARLDALATPTPWDVDVVRGSWTDSVVSQVEPHAIVAQWIVSTDAAFIASAPADIAWLLDRVRDLEVGILTACQIGSRGLNAQETQALASLMHDLDVPGVDDA